MYYLYRYFLFDTLNGDHEQVICKKSVLSIVLNLVPRMLEIAFPASRSQNFLHPTRLPTPCNPNIFVTAGYSTTTINLLQILLKPLFLSLSLQGYDLTPAVSLP